jgi:uncharacterized protein YbjT (DUF2867 family)
MKKILIAGSSGMIGNLVLQTCLENGDIGHITLINRKPSGLTDSRVTEVIHQDFLDLEPIKGVFSNQDICFYCVGIYTGQVPADEFNKITIDYTNAFGTILHHQSPQATFCFLSGQGADSSETSKVLFAKAKGIAENHLLQLGFPKVFIFRPGYIYPVTPRKEPNLFYRLTRVLYPLLSFVYPDIGLTSVQLAEKMVEVGLKGYEKAILENKDIRGK